ncbi:TonB-dependent receptor [Alistipes sp.]|uniref:TonB-dependent receptor n=1 Tax=Alistipes sp. TaxID=1872444 RepID=UPI0025BFF988|nr:TonB-dependent receptor [Alistipes sp.]
MSLRKILLTTLFLCISGVAGAVSLKGVIVDKTTQEVLVGATVMVNGTTKGTTTDAAGRFELNLAQGPCSLVISYISFVTRELNVRIEDGMPELRVELEPDSQMLSSVTVTARKNLESERSLQTERIASNVAIENMGAKEMSVKGISNVQEGLRKMAGISIAQAGQLIVRGLGDRYSITTLNGQPIASPNPDNKLIPLDIFPSSTVKNITVSKVYEVSSYADYSGAHINIDTRENSGDDFFTVDFHAGGQFNTLGGDFYRMDHRSLFTQPAVDGKALSSSLSEFREYVKTKDIFDTDFSVSKKTALPVIGGNLAWGREFKVGRQKVSLLASGGMSNDLQTLEDAEFRRLEATGTITDEYAYDSYASELKMAALASLSTTLRDADRISYTFFYARNAMDTYMRREGYDQESHHLIGSNDVMHVYKLMTNQLNGIHEFGKRWKLRWSGSYTLTASDEPDRRQVMYLRNEDGSLSLFKLNQQETMRYFGTLDENEWNAHAAVDYGFGTAHKFTAGFSFKDKSRDYEGVRFYYNLSALSPEIKDIYSPNDYLNFENVANGTLGISRHKQPKDAYEAGNRILAGYLSLDLKPLPELLINAGVRYEASKQWVRYHNDQSMRERRDLDRNDFFPALNVKYEFGEKHQLRLAASRTITRPSFIEMAPFLYQESYGSVQLRGNEDLQNSYNYNLDLRYEFLNRRGDMVSITGYYKYLDEPIERVQTLAGGAAVHTFRNADNGMAAGLEVEVRKALTQTLRIGVNGTYMYTNVKLPEGGAYTNKERALQGASPYLVNADLTWSPRFGEVKQLNLALLYNLQGPRIHAVGISGLGDIEQRAVHTLNFSAGYRFCRWAEVKLQLTDLLNRAMVFEQEVPQTGGSVEVERYRRGAGFEIGMNLKF